MGPVYIEAAYIINGRVISSHVGEYIKTPYIFGEDDDLFIIYSLFLPTRVSTLNLPAHKSILSKLFKYENKIRYWEVEREREMYKQYICLCLPPDRTWHKVNDPKVDYSRDLGEGKVGHEPRLEPCLTMLVIGPLCNVSLMSLARHGPKAGSRHVSLIIA